ncbi:alpha/beta hydrolase [Aquipuribacter hungaricus]|uniref:Alpha/beta hydrolase n=1 Tax=Aquipuribacter hungaricus TaxID=545624 RepID=A0ABV7WIK7_9MICO
MVRRPLVPALPAAVLVAVLALGSSAAASPQAPEGGVDHAAEAAATARAAAAAGPLDWQPCGEGLEAFLCATLEVPSDYDETDGPTTTLALTLLPASGTPEQRIGTLLTNPGGPGGSGVDFVQQSAPYAYTPEVLAAYDVLGFDPRGVSRSDPATCFATAAEELGDRFLQLSYPLGVREESRFQAESRRFAVRCNAVSGDRFATSSTADVARDMDVVRRAVGDTTLHYAGYSYGTYLGATYARLFPATVGRFVLDGTVDPLAWSGTGTGDAASDVPLGIRTRQAAGADESLDEFTRLCREAGPQGCSLAALGDPAVTVPALFDRLATDPYELPLPDGTTIEIDQQLAVLTTFQTLYSPAGWRDLADLLLALSLPVPDPQQVGAAAVGTRGQLGAALRQEDYPSVGGNLASLCVDTLQTGRPEDYDEAIDAYDAQHPYFARARGWVGLPCEHWRPAAEDRFTGPWEQTTQAPVLVIGTRFDPATPYSQTQPYADLFPAAGTVTLDGWGHTAIGKSACVDARITAYLVDGETPADLVCAPDTTPFQAPSPGARSVPRPDVPAGLPQY